MNFTIARERLRRRLHEMISDDLTTTVEIAEYAGVAQPHISNFLNQQRGISFDLADTLLRFAVIELEDLISVKDLCEGRPFGASSLPDFIPVPVVSARDAEAAHIQQRHAKRVVMLDGNLAAVAVNANGRGHWHRFVAVENPPNETLVIDRHVCEGDGRFAVTLDSKVSMGELFLVGRRMFFRPDDTRDPVVPAEHVIGKVAQIRREC